MDQPARYCVAFPETALAAFPSFAAARARADRAAAQAEPIVYLHGDLRVRSGMFDDDPIVFETADPAWAAFCSQALSFPPAWIAGPS